MPPQFDFVFRKWAQEVKDDPSLADPAAVQGDHRTGRRVLQGRRDPGSRRSSTTLEDAFARSWAGTTPDEFEAQVREWRRDDQATEVQRALHRARLQADARTVRPTQGARVSRVRVLGRRPRLHARVRRGDLWGIYKEDVIGSAADYEYKNGKIVRTAEILGGLALGPGKPEHIFAQTGRLPVFAGGNADVDIEMLESARFAPAGQPRRRRPRVRLHQRRPRSRSPRPKSSAGPSSA